MSERREPIPAAAAVLGGLGVLPFVAVTLIGMNRTASIGPYVWWTAYGAVILSFMGGAQWGLAMAQTGARRARGLAVSVLPALAGWAALAAPARPRLVILIAGFALLLVYDLWTVRGGQAPGWYGRLRLYLTICVTACLIAALAAGR